MSTVNQNQPAQTQATMPPERLAEIRARLTAEGLTPGPWRLEYESCDCSDGLCGHGSYVTAVITPEPTPIAAERIKRTGEEPRDYDFHRTEMPDFTDADWELMAHAPQDVRDLLAEVARQAREIERLTADAADFEMLTGQQCENGKHPDWAVDSENNHRCPWCRIAKLESELAKYVGKEPTLAEEAQYRHEQQVRARIAQDVNRAERPVFAKGEDPVTVVKTTRAIDIRLIEMGPAAPYWVPEGGAS